MKRRPLVSTWVSLLVVTLACAGTGTGEAAVPARASIRANIPAAATHSVTLITGDTVHLERLPGGRQVANVRPGAGRDRMRFQQMEVDGELRVIPEDAIPHLASKQLDDGLFNITDLVESAYDDAHRSTLPLIVTYSDVRRGHGDLAATTTGALLESIGAQATTVDKARAGSFWESLHGRARLAAGVERIRLDRRVRATLDRSVPQIGAPQAWQAGYDGRGVSVAVLDTGIDGDHPDLAGSVVETRNFSTSPDTEDRFGHGTHVASIVAGRAHKGVAPGARLLAGKVLDDNGFGQESWIIDGMEWAGSSGAKVINMSLGSGPTDGTDPMSQAVDQITAQHGVLFVISAGNDGESGEFTVGSPGTANSALTVGAIDRDDSLAAFSSRGPRLGDFAVKPDITAPGVGIVAARAAGTSMGTPVGEHHTAASGTSMAAPHVAGAAAILAQQHPEWTPVQLKDALASTAVRNGSLGVYEQGGGRVDLARATTQPVIGTATLDLGRYDHGDTTVTRKQVTYVNTGSTPVTLDLRLSLGGAAGVRLTRTSVDVPASGSATVDVLVDAGALPRGRQGGYLEATSGSSVVHTSLGVLKEAPKHRVTLSAVGRDGGQAWVPLVALFGEDRRFDHIGYLPEGATRTVEVAEGVHHLAALITTGVAPDAEDIQIVDPALLVDRDRSVVLDARKARRVVIETPHPAQQRGIFSFYVHREFGSRRITNSTMDFDGTRYLSVTPTAKVTDGSFEFGSRWSLVAPMLTTSVVGVRDFEPELMYLGQSPALDGTRRLPLVDVGPGDFQGRDVRGKIAFVHGSDLPQEELVAGGAAAGAAMVLIVPGPDEYAWTVWQPTGERLPAMGTILRQSEGARLLDLLRRGPVTLQLRGVPVSPYLYDVLQLSEQQVPAQVVHRVSDRNSATVTTHYHENGGESFAKEQRFAWRPWQTTANLQYQRWMTTPQTRQEIVSAGAINWQHRVKHYFSWESMNPLAGGMTTAPVRYRPGQRVDERWFGPVVRPAIPSGVPGLATYREGDTLTLRVAPFVDNATGHYSHAEGDTGGEPDAGAVRLYRDGVLVDQGEWAWGSATVAPGAAAYRLEFDVTRSSPEWEFGTRTRTAWMFRSGTAASRTLLPMLQVDYEVGADLRNRVRAGRPQLIGLGLRHQDGLPRASGGGLKVWSSYDDGKTWQRVAAWGHGSRYAALLVHPRVNGYVSLRVQASDRWGNTVDQTVIRAYGLAG